MTTKQASQNTFKYDPVELVKSIFDCMISFRSQPGNYLCVCKLSDENRERRAVLCGVALEANGILFGYFRANGNNYDRRKLINVRIYEEYVTQKGDYETHDCYIIDENGVISLA